jgi:molybdopterin converting factor small subunit
LAEIKFFGYLVDIVGSRAKEVRLERPVALRVILPSSFPEENIIILINQKPGTVDSLIKDEDAVVLMPVLSGG